MLLSWRLLALGALTFLTDINEFLDRNNQPLEQFSFCLLGCSNLARFQVPFCLKRVSHFKGASTPKMRINSHLQAGWLRTILDRLNGLA